jgi:hypothetical protein
MDTPFDPKLLDYAATETQRERLQAWLDLGSQTEAAKQCGCDARAIRKALKACQKRAAADGYAPGHWENGVAPGYRMGKVTVQRGPDGKVERAWERQHPQAEQWREICQQVKADLVEDVKPYTPAPFAYPDAQDDIIPWFQIGDAHLGMVSYMRETGHNFDLDIAAAELQEAFKMLMDRTEPGKRCVINDLGDFTHVENFKGETERGGYRLDVDTRFPKMIRVYTRVMRALIDAALTKFETVDVIVNQGNHSRTNDIWMREYSDLYRELIEARYGREGRVNAICNESVYIGYLMGDTFVMTHHSDKCSGEKLVDVMFKDFFNEVKQARHLYIDTGHIHHKMAKKERGIVWIESWNNLASNDKHHHDAGYRSRQSMSVAIRSRRYGQLGSYTVPVEMVWDRLSRSMGVKTSEPIGNRAFVA